MYDTSNKNSNFLLLPFNRSSQLTSYYDVLNEIKHFIIRTAHILYKQVAVLETNKPTNQMSIARNVNK